MRKLKAVKPPNLEQLDLSLEPYREDERMRILKEEIDKFAATFESVAYEKSYSALFEMLCYSQMPFFDIKGLTSQLTDGLSF